MQLLLKEICLTIKNFQIIVSMIAVSRYSLYQMYIKGFFEGLEETEI